MKLCVPCGSRGSDPPDLAGFEQDNGEWRLHVGHYRDFISDVTGVPVEEDPAPDHIKTIQARLEGCLEAYERDGQCSCDDFEKYEHVDSIRSVYELSRFFRRFVADRIEGEELSH